MSRQKDLNYIENQIQKLRGEAVKIQEAFQAYSVDMGQVIRDILTKAGVWEEINKLEEERLASRNRMQTKIQQLNQEAADLQKVRNFLLGREQQEATSEPASELPVVDAETTVENTVAEEAPEEAPAATEPPRSRPQPPV